MRTVRDHIEHCKELSKGFGKVWPRERIVEHWRKLAADPAASHIARETAFNALGNLRVEREPGSDDEAIAA